MNQLQKVRATLLLFATYSWKNGECREVCLKSGLYSEGLSTVEG